MVLTSPLPECVNIEYALRLGFKTSNNEAEYETFISGLRLAKAIGAQRLHIHNDSQLVVKQVMEEYQAKEEKILSYLTKVKGLLKELEEWKFEQIPHSSNVEANSLARLASTPNSELTRTIPVEYLSSASINESAEEVLPISGPKGPTWMHPIISYLES